MARVFAGSAKGLLVIEVSPEVEEAYDILVADGMSGEHAADMATAMGRACLSGAVDRDPVWQAHHAVELRQALRAVELRQALRS